MGSGLRRATIGLRGRKFARLARHPSLWKAARCGVLASLEHEVVPLGTPGTVIDVGASHGQFALLANLHFPRARIVSFEPLPTTQILNHGLRLVGVYNVAEAESQSIQADMLFRRQPLRER